MTNVKQLKEDLDYCRRQAHSPETPQDARAAYEALANDLAKIVERIELRNRERAAQHSRRLAIA